MAFARQLIAILFVACLPGKFPCSFTRFPWNFTPLVSAVDANFGPFLSKCRFLLAEQDRARDHRPDAAGPGRARGAHAGRRTAQAHQLAVLLHGA